MSSHREKNRTECQGSRAAASSPGVAMGPLLLSRAVLPAEAYRPLVAVAEVSLPRFPGHLDCGDDVARRGVLDGSTIPAGVPPSTTPFGAPPRSSWRAASSTARCPSTSTGFSTCPSRAYQVPPGWPVGDAGLREAFNRQQQMDVAAHLLTDPLAMG